MPARSRLARARPTPAASIAHSRQSRRATINTGELGELQQRAAYVDGLPSRDGVVISPVATRVLAGQRHPPRAPAAQRAPRAQSRSSGTAPAAPGRRDRRVADSIVSRDELGPSQAVSTAAPTAAAHGRMRSSAATLIGADPRLEGRHRARPLSGPEDPESDRRQRRDFRARGVTSKGMDRLRMRNFKVTTAHDLGRLHYSRTSSGDECCSGVGLRLRSSRVAWEV